MATYGRTLRRGLPRTPGGDAWPGAGVAPDGVGVEPSAEVAESAGAAGVPQSVEHNAAGADRAEATAEPGGAAEPGAAAAVRALRQGLPRTPGGEPWPPAGVVAGAGGVPQSAEHSVAAGDRAEATVEAGGAPATAAQQSVAHSAAGENRAGATAEAGETLRRGLPRVAGGDPWPPAGTVSAVAAPAESVAATEAADAGTIAAATTADTTPVTADTAAAVATEVATTTGPREPLPFTPTVWPGRAATHRPAPKPEPRRFGPFTAGQWIGTVIVGGIGLIIAAAMVVAAVRVLLSLDFMRDFMAAFPGEYHLPEGAPVGIPAWLGWQHFFNVFLMVLIIRTGLRVRTEKRPAVFWTPRNDPKGKTSLTIWFHQALDVLWLVNGVVFVVLLFVTGQWMRIIPTSWEVFPNALSAGLQYVSLDWPTENGWVNYNSLQQLAYFTTVFIAAPLSAITGYRMSGLWPKRNAKMNAAWPIDWARKVHFPVMLYFVVFIAIHVFLVFATGALRNLNHMYAAQGSVDPTAYADNWTGFWFFVASLAVIVAAWVAARPLTIAPIARLFGNVTAR